MKSRLVLAFSALLLISCLGCGSSNMPPAAQALPHTLVANLDLNSISSFHVDPDSKQVSDLGVLPTGICLSPRYLEPDATKHFLFVTCQTSNNVATFSIDKTSGKLLLVGSPCCCWRCSHSIGHRLARQVRLRD